MKKVESLDDMDKRITPENNHPEISGEWTDEELRQFRELPNEFDTKEWTWDEDPGEEECIKKTEKLIKRVEDESFEFKYTAEEIRKLNQQDPNDY